MKGSRKQFVVVLASLAVVIAQAGGAKAAKVNPQTVYRVADLPSLGGTNSRGNSINNRGWVAGYSNLAGNQRRHATLWIDGAAADLGTLGGPNSSVAWPVKNNAGRLAGISQTSTPDPLGENWSCSAFFPGATATGFTCLGFVWESGVMTALPTLGGNNGFATGSNNRGQTVGWAETAVHDSTCVAPQVLQFKAAIWGPRANQVEELPLVAGDTSSAATAINDRGQVVGISGRCDQAVGRFTAIHAVLWDRDGITDLGNLGRLSWNTPMAINEGGDIVGFAPVDDTDPDNPQFHAFAKFKGSAIQDLDTLSGDLFSEALGINAGRQIVGISCHNADGSGVCRAFLWQDGEMTDLNTLVAPGYANLLTTAQDINDAGVITGRALTSGGQRPAFVATPHP
jgi:probable HAF family extracellular repeat protein